MGCYRCDQLKNKSIRTEAWRLKHKDHGGIDEGKPYPIPSGNLRSLICKCGAVHYHLEKERSK